VRGVRPQTQPGQDVCYHLMEVHHGPFERIFQFSFPISQDDIKAVYQKGFLIVEVRKQLLETRKVTVEIMQEIDGP
jgi:HSP20 family molecular chaperone IbpA